MSHNISNLEALCHIFSRDKKAELLVSLLIFPAFSLNLQKWSVLFTQNWVIPIEENILKKKIINCILSSLFMCYYSADTISQLVSLPVGKQLRLGPWGWGQIDWQVPTARVCDCNAYNHMLQVDHMVVGVVSASCCLVHWPNHMLWTDSSAGQDGNQSKGRHEENTH